MRALRPLLISFVLLVSACAVVPPHARGHLADPSMDQDALEQRSVNKLHTAREAAGGGGGASSGGGCACSN